MSRRRVGERARPCHGRPVAVVERLGLQKWRSKRGKFTVFRTRTGKDSAPLNAICISRRYEQRLQLHAGYPDISPERMGAFAVYVVKPLHLPRRRTPQTVRNLSFKPKAVGDFKGIGSGRRSPAARSRPGAGPDAAAVGLLRGLQEPGARRAPGAAAGWPAVVVLGYGDLNDHDKLRDGSLLALADDDLTGENRERDRGHPLARTLNRPTASAQRPESPSRACPKTPAARRSGRIKRTSRNSSSR